MENMHICNSPRVNIMRESYNQSDELPTKEKKTKAKCTEEKKIIKFNSRDAQ